MALENKHSEGADEVGIARYFRARVENCDLCIFRHSIGSNWQRACGNSHTKLYPRNFSPSMYLKMGPDSGCVSATTKLSHRYKSHKLLGVVFTQIGVRTAEAKSLCMRIN